MCSRFLPLLALWLAFLPWHHAAAGDLLPQYESSTVTVDQANAQTWRAVTFARPFATPPVVIAGPPTQNDAAPLTVRVRNVTATGFEYQLDEWDYLDGVHGKESFSYLAVQTGTFQIGAVMWQAGRVTGVGQTAQPVSFASAFTKQPVVLAQVESAQNPQALMARVNAVTATQFNLHIQAQQSVTATLAGESVSYLAATPGTAALDGASFSVVRPAYGVAAPWRGMLFGGTRLSPNFFAQAQTEFNAAPVVLRQRLLGATSAQLCFQGEASTGAAKPIAGEFVGFLAMAESQGEIRANLEIGTYHPAQPNRSVWYPVTFDKPYNNPIVVFGPLTESDQGPARVRVRNVSSTGFEFQLEEWAYQDGVHGAERVDYLVAEQGTYTIGGQRWNFGQATAVGTVAKVAVFPSAFARVPVVFPQIVTTTDPAPAHARVQAVLTYQLAVVIEQEAAATQAHKPETIHWVAVTPGSGRMLSSRILFDAVKPLAKLTEAYGASAFEGHTLASPFFFGDTQSRTDRRAVDTRFRNLTEKAVEFRMEGENSRPPTAAHPPEAYAYLAFAGEADEDEDGMADAWELAHGLNPADPNDADGDADHDGRSNLQEYRDGTNPQVADNGPLITASVTVAQGYRKEGTAVKFRLARPAGGGVGAVQFTMSGVASPAGYRVTDAAGNGLVGSINFAEGDTFADIVVMPIADGTNRYPEAVTLTLNPSLSYQVGTPSSASATISDAEPTAANEQLFVAYLTRQGSASTYASGVATLYLNGSKSAARVSLSFSGLTSPQTNAYLRYGNPGGIGTELRPTLGNGQVTNVVWNIVPAGSHSGQNIIDALYQTGGQYAYINIGTSSYPVGEIAGTWTRQTGSSVFVPPGDPPAIAPVTGANLSREVARFLTQATFGPTQAEIDALTASVANTYGGDRIAAFGAWIDQQLALPQTNQLDLVQAADAEEFAERGTDSINYTSGNEPRDNNRRRSWWTITVKAPDQLRQRFAFTLSELLVISDKLSEVKNRHYGTAHYYDQLAAAATGNYRVLLEDVSKSPLMGKYLSSLQNQKAVVDSQGKILISPDENYAREIMQLFSIGLVNLYLDGSLQLNADGTPIQTYSNADITDLARVFTGWSFSKRNGAKSDGYPVLDNTTFLLGGGPAYFQAEWLNPMKNFATYHDTGAKTVLGASIAAGLDGPADLSAAVGILFNHQNVAPFISRQLIQRLVTSNPSAGYVYRVAKKFENNGSGVRGDLKAVLKAVLLDYEARSLELLDNVGYGKQKEPIVRYVQLLRAANAKSAIPLSLYNSYGYPAAQYSHFPVGTTLYRYPLTDTNLGQSPISAPTVFNWFLPDFNPGGSLGAAGLVAPEMQLTTETGVVQAINYHYTLAEVDTGQSVQALFKPANANQDNVALDRTPFEAIYNGAISAGQTVPQATATLLDALDLVLTAGSLKAEYAAAAAPNPRSLMIDAGSSLTSVTTAIRVKEMLYLVVTSPSYLHQK